MASSLLTDPEKREIVEAITTAENKTSGEIRLHIEKKCGEDVMDHAAFIFEKLEMHKTELRNGVLFYVSFDDHKLAILGDAGINSAVPDDFWNAVKDELISSFKRGEYVEGLKKGIHMAGEQLKEHFPVAHDDVDELSNEISFGEEKQ